MDRLAVAEAAAAKSRVLEEVQTLGTPLGCPLMKDRTNPPEEAYLDIYLHPYDRDTGIEAAMQAHLCWAIALVGEIARDGTVHFGATEHAALS